ncbi:IS481 family transposase ISRhba4 [subsurface metagenome]
MTEKEILRKQRWRLGIIRHAEEVTHNIAKTCRYFGISRTAFYKWYERYQNDGVEGLKDRSCRPLHSPHATNPEIIAKIIYLRQTYHFGPWKIQMYLQRYHDISVSRSGVWRILKRLNMNCLPYNQRYKRHKERWKRYEKPEPGHRIQVDVKFLEKIPGTRRRYYQYTAIDDCTRLRVLKIYERCNQRSSIQFVDYVLSRLPFQAEVIQTDNGSEFQGQFHWHILDKGINHVYIRPRRPRLNGKVERSHRIDEEEFYRMMNGMVIDDADLFNEKLREWEDFYNYNRPHAAHKGMTPYEKFREKVKLIV